MLEEQMLGLTTGRIARLICAGAIVVVAGCAQQEVTGAPSVEPVSGAPSQSVAVVPAEPGVAFIGAGDICTNAGIANARQTAALIEAEPNAVVFTLGDNSNAEGTAKQYRDCYGSTWGAFKNRTHPAPGNHDMITSNGGPYYSYFGTAAGPAGKGYYSYDLNFGWHVVVLNAICAVVSGCGKGSPQELWLKTDLAASAGRHIIAIWHIPAFSSGPHGLSTTYRTWWRDLYAAHAELILDGHDHEYQRFARQSPDGAADPAGIREFVVGTGGASQYPFVSDAANTELRHTGTYGVLKLTLRVHSYSWQFVPVAGDTFTDTGTIETHG
jgi:hypothetical protein